MSGTGGLRLNRLRVLYRGSAAYDQAFHEGINIIRGQNGSGKSTIADFIFFAMGGEFDDWKEAASSCDEVQAEIHTDRGTLTIRRRIESKTEPVLVYFGPISEAARHSLESWEQFPLRRKAQRESFSQVMFRSLVIPEAKSEGASNITMHQLLRLCYSDQRSPAARLFRFENFDTHAIREAVGDLVCGISGYEVYEIGLALRELQKEHSEVESELAGLLRALPSDEAIQTPRLIKAGVDNLLKERDFLQTEIKEVDDRFNAGEVKDYLEERKNLLSVVNRDRSKLQSIEETIANLELELREIGGFQEFLSELSQKLSLAEDTFEAVGTIEFTRCPACGADLDVEAAGGNCVVCKNPTEPEQERSRYNQVRLDLEIQSRESKQLITQKNHQLSKARTERRRARAALEHSLGQFDLQFSGPNGPREAFLAERTSRLGHIDAEIDFLVRNLEIADLVEGLSDKKRKLKTEIDALKERSAELQKLAKTRRRIALNRISSIGASLLRADFKRQDEFEAADRVELNFLDDAISVDGRMNFAESSNVYLKNSAILSLLLAAGEDAEFFHPRFVLFDNIEDKGMEEARSHLFQRLIVERATELEVPFQVIFTTSMMNPELELDDYTVGPAYTKDNRTLDLQISEKVAIEADDHESQEQSDPEPVTEPSKTQESGTKLDLARAYIISGDVEGAQRILEELIREGEQSEAELAEGLLSTLVGKDRG